MTCLIAGGPCSNQAKEVLEKYYCTKCSFYEKLDRDYISYIKKDIVRQLQGTSEKSTDDEDNDDLDDELTDAMLENHCYHLSWAVFKHLPCNKTNIKIHRSNISPIIFHSHNNKINYRFKEWLSFCLVFLKNTHLFEN